jgi:hypothetical protein
MEDIKSMNGDIEKIQFDITLVSEFWDKAPEVEILVDDISLMKQLVLQETTLSFYVDLKMEQPHKLQIKRSNKTPDQCVDGKDQILKITKIKIDHIDIENIFLSKSYFLPVYPEPWASQQKDLGIELETKVIGESYLGHNGTWVLEFFSPFYRYLIKCMS